jgi:hypothetical protein
MINKTHVLAIAVAGAAVAASALLMKLRTRRREALEHELALEVWDDECGPPADPVAPPRRAARPVHAA